MAGVSDDEGLLLVIYFFMKLSDNEKTTTQNNRVIFHDFVNERYFSTSLGQLQDAWPRRDVCENTV